MANFFDQFDAPNGPSEASRSGITAIESGGRYDLLGPVTRTGDRAIGKYQVMGRNVPSWTREALGRELTPEEFRASPEAQDAVFNHRFGMYEQKYGPAGAARAWFAGEGGMNDMSRRDVLGTSVADYERMFNAHVKRSGADNAMAFAQKTATPAKAANFFDQFDAAPPAGRVSEQLARPSQIDARFPEEQQNETLKGQLEAAGPAMAGDRGVLHATAIGAVQGATFNLGDELSGLNAASGLSRDGVAATRAIPVVGPFIAPAIGAARMGAEYMAGGNEASNRYNAASKAMREDVKNAEQFHPVASLAGNLAGAVAMPVGGMAGAATTGARIARGAKVGAAGGALAGAGAGETTEERVSSGLTGAGAGAAIGGALGGVLGRVGAPKQGPVKASDIFATAKEPYREFRDMAGKIEIPEETAKGFATRIRDALDKGAFSEEFAKPIYRAVDLLEKDGTKSIADLQQLKQLVGRGFGSSDKPVRDAAAVASKEIVKIINEVSPDAGAALKVGDEIYSSAKSLQELQRKSDIAGLRTGRAGYGGNSVNAMRQVLSPIVQRGIEGKTTGFKPGELEAMRAIVEGTTATNALRLAGQVSPSKGIMASGGATYAGVTFGGAAGFAIPALGAASNKLATVLTARQIGKLKEKVAQRSPKYAEAVQRSVDRYERAVDEFTNGPSSGRLAKVIGASRALSGGLNKDGIQVSSGDLLRLLQAPGTGRADQEEVPREETK